MIEARGRHFGALIGVEYGEAFMTKQPPKVDDVIAAYAGREAVKIGITCYPTFGGSGVVATELGVALARGGDDVHFISYAMPSRLNVLHERVRFHEVTVTPYPLFDPIRRTRSRWRRRWRRWRSTRSSTSCTCTTRFRTPSARTWRSEIVASRNDLKFITTLHGTDITLVGRDPSYLPITRFGIEVSDGVTAVSQWLRDETAKNFGTKKEIEVIPNFVDPARFRKHAGALSGPLRVVRRKAALPRLELPSR